MVLLNFKQRLSKQIFVPQNKREMLIQPQNLRFNILAVPSSGKYEREILLKITKHKLGAYDSPWAHDMVIMSTSDRKKFTRFSETEEPSGESQSFPDFKSIEPIINIDQLSAFDLATELVQSPDLSIKMQRFVETCNPDDLSKIVVLLKSNIYKLCVIKQGSYLIQKVMDRLDSFREEMINFSMENFEFMSTKDFSCRILRVLLRGSESYRAFVTRRIQNNLEFCLSNFSSIFLVTESIKMSQNMKEFDFLVKALNSNPQVMISNRYFKRILVTFVEYCSRSQLKVIVENLAIRKNFRRYMNDKFGSHIFLILMQRGLPSSFEVLIEQLINYPEQVMRTKYYGQTMLRAVETANENVKKQLQLICLDAAYKRQASYKPETIEKDYFAIFHLFCTLSLWDPEREPQLSYPLSSLTCKLTGDPRY